MKEKCNIKNLPSYDEENRKKMPQSVKDKSFEFDIKTGLEILK